MTAMECSLDLMLEGARSVLEERLGGRRPVVGIILGSGLNPFADQIEDAVLVPYGEVPGMRRSTANGHVGRFVCGMLEGVCVLVMQGRIHGYEGATAQEVAFPVWLMRRLGVGTLVITNAAGALNEAFDVGDFCLMTDQLNFTGRNPVASCDAAELAPRFFSMLDAFDPDLRAAAAKVAFER